MRHAATLDLEQFEDAEIYDRLERARRQTVGRIGLFTLLLATVQDLITLVSLGGALARYVPWLLVLLVVAVLPSLLGETRFAALGYSLLYSLDAGAAAARLPPVHRGERHVGEGVEALRALGFPGGAVRPSSRREFYEANKMLAIRRSVVSTLLAALGTLGYYGAYAVIIHLTVTGHRSPAGPFTIGVLTFLAASFRQSRDLIQRSLLSLSQVYEQSLYLDDLFCFFAIEPRIRCMPGARPIPTPMREGFVFEDVGFRYPAPSGGRCATSPSRSRRASGSRSSARTAPARRRWPSSSRGSTTRAKAGSCSTASTSASTTSASLRRNVGVIFQDFVRYDFVLGRTSRVGSIERRGGRAGHPRPPRERSLADTVAARLAGRYDQMLGRRFEGGVDLSGGEWQKVALARAYMREAQLLVLDEPTAALDARAEYEVFLRFAELTPGKMAVLISHRFSTVRMADRIFVLRDGELVEEGTHEELVALGGLYAELFELQAAGYR